MSIKQHEILTDNIDSKAELSTAAGIASLQLISTCVLSVTVYNGEAGNHSGTHKSYQM